MEELTYKDISKVFVGKTPPYAFLFLSELNKNIELIKTSCRGKKVRLATQSIRSLHVLKFLLQKLGDDCSGLMCFHLDELLWLSDHLNTHFLMGYPQQPNQRQAERLAEKIKQGLRIVQMVDSIDQMKHLDLLAQKNEVTFEVCLDLELSFKFPGFKIGGWHSSLNKIDKVDEILRAVREFRHLKLVGIRGYEAQLAGLGDEFENPLKSLWVALLKKLSQKKMYRLRAYATQRASKENSIEFINGGGTGTIEMTSGDPAITEVAVGSGFYSPALFDSFQDKYFPSLGYAMAVQRTPSENVLTVHGGGYVGSGNIGKEKAPVILSPKGAELIESEMAGEIQTPIIYRGLQKIQIGDPIFFRHSKAGELLERFQSVYVISENQIIDEWKSYRGDGQCFI